jgi:formylglycine-generating enzyme required for sulfatase activity
MIAKAVKPCSLAGFALPATASPTRRLIMKRALVAWWALGLLACLAAAGCGGSSDDTEPPRVGDDDDYSPPPMADDDSDDDDNDTSPTLELNWVPIPAGTFSMGCSENDDLCDDAEYPAHDVTLDAFEMTDTEITQEQYEIVAGTNPSYFTPANGYDECPDCPVEQVAAQAARQFCEAAGGYLPTEAQVEYAARGGTTTRWHCGDDEACLAEIAWYGDNADGQTHPVAQKTPNDYGLYDMAGNVWEMTQDWFDESYYSYSPEENPTGPASGTFLTIRGGSWNDGANQQRVSYRGVNMPDNANYFIGFRCARAAQ